MERNISAWNPHAPPLMTDAKREIENVSGNPLFDYAADLVESGCLFQAVVRYFGLAALQDRLQKSHFAANARNSSDQLVKLWSTQRHDLCQQYLPIELEKEHHLQWDILPFIAAASAEGRT
jgi:hypothetical protein